MKAYELKFYEDGKLVESELTYGPLWQAMHTAQREANAWGDDVVLFDPNTLRTLARLTPHQS